MREIIQTKDLAASNLKNLERELKDSLRDNTKHRMRDKADNDIRHGKNEEKMN